MHIQWVFSMVNQLKESSDAFQKYNVFHLWIKESNLAMLYSAIVSWVADYNLSQFLFEQSDILIHWLSHNSSDSLFGYTFLTVPLNGHLVLFWWTFTHWIQNELAATAKQQLTSNNEWVAANLWDVSTIVLLINGFQIYDGLAWHQTVDTPLCHELLKKIWPTFCLLPMLLASKPGTSNCWLEGARSRFNILKQLKIPIT